MTRSTWLSLTLGALLAVLSPWLVNLALAASPAEATTAPPDRNEYLAGASVRTSGPVAGDIAAVGGRVVVDHPIHGDALLMGGSVDARAAIGDDLRAFGGDVSVEGAVGGELLAAGGNVLLMKSARIAQGATLGGGLVTIDGKIDGRLRASAHRIVLNGEVNGNARLIADRIELGPAARISGSLRHTSRELQRADGAVVSGTVTREESAEDDRDHHEQGSRDRDRPSESSWEYRWQTSMPSWVGAVLGFLGSLAAGVALLLLFPNFTHEAPQRIRSSPWLALAVGFGTLVGLPVFAVLLMVTVLGIPLGIAAIAAYPLLLLIGYLLGAFFIAGQTRRGLRKQGSSGRLADIGLLAIALAILMLLAIVPVVGPVTIFITTVAGLGACILEWHRRRQSSPAASA